MVTKEAVERAQWQWAEFLVRISALRNEYQLCVEEAQKGLIDLYAFDRGSILFKPTFAKAKPFRTNLEGTLSYFVGGNKKYPEDKGFALKGWQHVRFENASMLLKEKSALVMGHYFFVEEFEERATKVEFTFGYGTYAPVDPSQESLRICLHHSSLPHP